jgi:tripartite-type tricarboxylate transporter receptor subunit TctC
MMKNTVPNCSSAIALAALIGFGPSVLAQQSAGLPSGYPSKPIRIITGSSGGSTDQIARGIASNLGERLKSPVIVEAKNNLAVDYVAKASPDGHTFLLTSSGTVMNAALLAEQRYDPRTALAPVTQLTEQSYLLVVHPSLPVRTVKEFIALAKSKPGALSFSTSGAGSEGHIGMELFKYMAGIDMVAIPYKGSAPATIDLVGGRVQASLLGSLAAVPLAKAGKIRILGVGGLRRIKILPDAPTISESGVPEFEATGWYGFFAPAGTSVSIINGINRETREILALPLLTDRIVGGGGEVVGNSPAEFKSVVEKELETWRKVISAANIKLD